MTTKHTVRLPDGTTAKRVSENRVYPFVVVAQPSRAYAEAVAREAQDRDRRNFAHYLESARVPVGEQMSGGYPNRQEYRDQAQAEIAAHGDADSYAAAKLAAQLAKVEAKAAAGHFDSWAALTWSSRAELAAKEAAKANAPSWIGPPIYCNAHVLETERA